MRLSPLLQSDPGDFLNLLKTQDIETYKRFVFYAGLKFLFRKNPLTLQIIEASAAGCKSQECKTTLKNSNPVRSHSWRL